MNSRRHFFKTAATLGAAAVLRPVMGRAATGASLLPPPAGNLRVVFLTDIHTRDDVPGIPAFLDLLAVRVNALQPHLILCGGDCIEGGFGLSVSQVAARWAIFQAFRQKLRAPFYVVPGNHDLVGVSPSNRSWRTGDPLADYLQQLQLPRAYRSFDQAGWHFVLLNSVDVLPDRSNYRGHISADQLLWLQDDLSRVSAQTPIVLLTHIPLQPTFSSFLESRLTAMRPNLVVDNSRDLLGAFAGKNLRLVLNGHLHVNSRALADGHDFIMGGAVCGEWWRGSSMGTPNGFGLLSLGAGNNGWQYFESPWVPNATFTTSAAL